MQRHLEQYTTIIGYGIGQYYEKTKSALQNIVKLDYLCDKKWETQEDIVTYDGIKIIKKDQIKDLENVLIIIFSGTPWGIESMKEDMGEYGFPIRHVDELIGEVEQISGKFLKENYPNGMYKDKKGNEIHFDETISSNVIIIFHGHGNKVSLGKNIRTGKLAMFFGNDGWCSVGDNTEICEGEFFVSGAKICIGKNCLFSAEVILRNHDSHHIFDATTHKRINYPKDIVVEDNVWIGYRVILLGGAHIGCGSVVGTGTITAGQFQDHVVVAGCPGRVIRENVCWSRDDTNYFNRDYLEECISQEVLKYL